MSYFGDRLPKENDLALLIDACIVQLQAVRYSPGIKAEERDKAIQKVQDSLPLIRRYLVYFRTKELESAKPRP